MIEPTATVEEPKEITEDAVPVPKPHRNWTILKLEFMRGPWQTLAQFARDKNIPNNANTWQRSKGWVKEKQVILTKAAEQVSGDLVTEKANDIKIVQERHARLARWMQLKAGEALKTLNPLTVDEARKLLLSGLSEERLALNMNSGRGGATNMTQVNLNLPKTNLDQLLDGNDTAGLLKLIADIKQQRAQRIGASTIIEGETETQ